MRVRAIVLLAAAVGGATLLNTVSSTSARPAAAPVVPDAAPRIVVAGGDVRSMLNVRQTMKYGDYVWNEDGAGPGPIRIRVDRVRQIISVFRGGDEIGTAVITYGADNFPTPAGRFPIRAKLRDHHSATYDAPMPFTLRLTPDGVAIHAVAVRANAATHGCVGVPQPFARRLFDAAKLGDVVEIS
jgi:hypothetical protein